MELGRELLIEGVTLRGKTLFWEVINKIITIDIYNLKGFCCYICSLIINKMENGEALIDNRYNNAINALTYGFNCLIYDSKGGKLYDCILSIHESYINILHIIIGRKVSYLLKLHEIYNITDNQYSTQAALKQMGIEHCLILYTQNLDSFTFAFKTAFEKQQLKIAMVMFVREAKMYYQRLNEFDPFKAEAMMTFLHADKDGGNILDIEEIEHILQQMKVQRSKQEIMDDIVQINKYLYEREKLKRSKDMTDSELNQMGFQYLLRFYSIKDDLAKYFSTYCPMFKLKVRSQKNPIVDVVRYNEKPLMSASQLKQFYEKVLVIAISEEECLQIIKMFPVYDGEGNEKQEQNDMISFNNFCSLIASRRNSAFSEDKKQQTQPMNHPISDYFIYCDFTDYSLFKRSTSSKTNKINFQMALKRGCRGLRIIIEAGKDLRPVVRMDTESSADLSEILKIIASKAFELNNYPIVLKLTTINCPKTTLDEVAILLTKIFQELLYIPPPNFTEAEALPSPAQLMRKILLLAEVNPKLMKSKEHNFPDESMSFFRLISLFGSKLDFQRKGQSCWNYCPLDLERIRKFEEVEDENMSNYTKKIMVKAVTGKEKGAEVNMNCTLAMRMGVQLIGLTFSNTNSENYLMQSLFLQNGGAKSGYILKPIWMCLRNPKTQYSKNFDVPLFLLNVRVVSGQSCVINASEQPSANCYVQLYLRGSRKEEEVNKKFTSGMESVGYYTKFGFDGEFTVYCLDLAVVVILVRAQSTKQILSGRAIPVRHLKQGLRPLFLLGEHFKQSAYNYMFIHTTRKEMPKKTNTYFDTKV